MTSTNIDIPNVQRGCLLLQKVPSHIINQLRRYRIQPLYLRLNWAPCHQRSQLNIVNVATDRCQHWVTLLIGVWREREGLVSSLPLAGLRCEADLIRANHPSHLPADVDYHHYLSPESPLRATSASPVSSGVFRTTRIKFVTTRHE